MLNVIRSLYENIKCCVKYNGQISDSFSCERGLLQGEILSPILFSLYITDCEKHFIHKNCPAINIQLINLFILMYADDMVLFSESIEDLQQLLDTLYMYNTKWDLVLNIDKTKFVVFGNSGNLKESEKVYYNNVEIENVNNFNYLGLFCNYNGKHYQTRKHISEQSRKTMFSVNSYARICWF